MATMINGELMKAMMLEAAACIEERKEEINDLNVFPVPDGDTGTNMAMTLGNCATELSKLQAPALGKVLEVMASINHLVISPLKVSLLQQDGHVLK